MKSNGSEGIATSERDMTISINAAKDMCEFEYQNLASSAGEKRVDCLLVVSDAELMGAPPLFRGPSSFRVA